MPIIYYRIDVDREVVAGRGGTCPSSRDSLVEAVVAAAGVVVEAVEVVAAAVVVVEQLGEAQVRSARVAEAAVSCRAT